jgi:hypothetical protein
MTVTDAYHILSSGNATPQAMHDANAALQRLGGITSAVCIEALLAPVAEAGGWGTYYRNTGTHVGGDQLQALRLKTFRYGAVQDDPWCEWGMGQLASTGLPGYPKNLVEADVFYRLAAMNQGLGSDGSQAKSQLAAVEGHMSSAEKAQADSLFHSAIPPSIAP